MARDLNASLTPLSGQHPPRLWDVTKTPRFQTLKFLGKGGQGFVQLAYDNQHHEHVAIKYIDRGWSREYYKYVLRETLNHQQLSLCKHPHIVEFHEVFLTPSYLAVVMEYVNGTNLQHYLEAAGGKLPEDLARFIFQQLVIAVDFCHKKGKVNRDIKLANILLQEGHLPLVKLCDFGFSKDKFDDSEPQTQIGTALFTAPEIFTNEPGQVYDAEAADVWSCGVVLFVMLFGCHPFLSFEDTHSRKHAQVFKLIENAVQCNVQVPAGAEELYPQALNLVRSILVSAPEQRCKLPAIVAHPWFQEKLPPGAMLLNAAYLSMDHSAAELRQTSEEVHTIITAALSVCMQEDGDSSSAVPGGDTSAMSEASHSYGGTLPSLLPSPKPSTAVVAGAAARGPPASGVHHHHASAAVGPRPGQVQSISNYAAQTSGHPCSQLGLNVAAGVLQSRHPVYTQQHRGVGNQTTSMYARTLDTSWQTIQQGGAHVPGTSHNSSGLTGTNSGTSMHSGSLAGSPGRQQGIASERSLHMQTLGALPQVTTQSLTRTSSRPLAMESVHGHLDSMAVSVNGLAALRSVNKGAVAGSVASALQMDPTGPHDMAEGESAPKHRARGLNAMDVSGCVLYDSSLLYGLDLQTDD